MGKKKKGCKTMHDHRMTIGSFFEVNGHQKFKMWEKIALGAHHPEA